MSLHSQDIHFSQFYNSPLVLNPALTGVSRGDIRLTGIYRSQWRSANAPYKTIHAAADKKFYSIAHETWWLNAGISMFYDRAGDANVSTSNIALSGSYTKMLDKENFLSFGISAGLGQRMFEIQNLTFDNQWNGDVFDPNRGTSENFSDGNIIYPDFGVGLNYRGQKSKTRSKIDLGAGVYHFNRPNQSYQSSDKSQLASRLSMYFLPTIQVNEKLDIVGQAAAQIQGNYLETIAGAAGRLYLSTKKSQEIAVQLGFEYRFNAKGDAFAPTVEVHYHDWMVGLSWDLNVSDFSVATNRNGGPEIALRYIIYKVYPIKAFKACPLI